MSLFVKMGMFSDFGKIGGTGISCIPGTAVLFDTQTNCCFTVVNFPCLSLRNANFVQDKHILEFTC